MGGGSINGAGVGEDDGGGDGSRVVVLEAAGRGAGGAMGGVVGGSLGAGVRMRELCSAHLHPHQQIAMTRIDQQTKVMGAGGAVCGVCELSNFIVYRQY